MRLLLLFPLLAACAAPIRSYPCKVSDAPLQAAQVGLIDFDGQRWVCTPSSQPYVRGKRLQHAIYLERGGR